MNERTWWFDATMFHESFDRKGRRASGLPRATMEFIRVARREPPPNIRLEFVRYDSALPGFRKVESEELDAVFDRAESPAPAIATLKDRFKQLAKDILRAMPMETSQRLVRMRRRGLLSATAPLWIVQRTIGRHGHQSSVAPFRAGGFYHPFAIGDTWINLGGWRHGGIPEAIAAIRADDIPLTTCVLMHDCIPLIYPEFCPREVNMDWRVSVGSLMAGTSVFLSNSECTRRDVIDMLITPAGSNQEVKKIRLGDALLGQEQSESESKKVRERLGLDEPYVLFVSTIEARKNHGLALRAWRTLQRKGRQPLPKLVFVGRWGWKTRDLREQIKDSDGLNRTVHVLESLSDSELDAVYRGALFTLFPSLYEGWGLPVRESLSYGKVCVAARNSAIVEAGGDFAIYFTDDCQQSLVEAVEALLDDPEARKNREARIRSEFAPVCWLDAWHDVVTAVSEFEGGGSK